MANNANWTIVMDDKVIIKKSGDGAGNAYTINDDAFLSDSKWSNIWAIQHGSTVSTDEVEYRDETPHSAYDASVLGDISQFTTKWDAAHLAKLQADWDADDRDESEKGSRPTSYSS